MKYAILDFNMQIKEFRDLDPLFVESLISIGNPKANYIKLYVEDPIPNYDPDTQIYEANSLLFEENSIRQTWTVRDLTSAEIAERKRQVWTAYEFLLRLTADERAAIRAMAEVNEGVADFLHLSQAAQEVVSDDPVTIMGMEYMVSVGIFSEQRKNEILGLV